MKLISFLSLIIISSAVISSCNDSKEVTDPDIAYKRKLYSKAAELYTLEFEKEKVLAFKANTAYRIAECWRMTNNFSNAGTWYKQAYELNYDVIAIFRYGEMLKTEEKYAEAIEQFKLYMNEEPSMKQFAKNQISDCEKAMAWKEEKTNVTVYPIAEINSLQSDFSPAYYQNNEIVFTSARSEATGELKDGWTGSDYFDLFVTGINEQLKYSDPKNFYEELNQSYNEGSVTFNKDFSVMYFTRCGTDAAMNDYCKIFKSTKMIDSGWSTPTEEKLFGDSINVGHPCLNADGTVLIVSANAEDAIGGKDLYYSYKTSEGWSSPQNLGSEINTKGDEGFPSLDAQGNLYFASNGLPGMGGLDIFYAEKSTGTKWTNVQNVKYPVNSGADDFGLIVDKAPADNMTEKSGYFTSSRNGGKGSDDIYRFLVAKKNFFNLEVLVLEKIYDDPLNPNSKVIDYKPIKDVAVNLDMPVGNAINIVNLTTDADGKAYSELEMETDYSLGAAKQPCYLNAETEFTTKGKYNPKEPVITMQVKIVLDKIFTNIDLNIPNILYGYDSTNLRSESYPVLDSLITLFKANPGVKIEIGSHTDCRGSDNYNLKLSQGRAESVVKYLIAQGLSADDFVAKGYGETEPLIICKDCLKCSEDEHQQNRRTTFTIIGAKVTECEQ